MKATGITMSGNHPRLILDGKKTMTRRTWGLKLINKDPDKWEYMHVAVNHIHGFRNKDTLQVLGFKCPYGVVGDLLWIKEAYAFSFDGKHRLYRADYLSICEALELDEFAKRWGLPLPQIKWSPSRFMPRAQCRIQVPIQAYRPERLWDISYADAKAEGYNSISDFAVAWDEINGKRYPWSGNWWVWAISF